MSGQGVHLKKSAVLDPSATTATVAGGAPFFGAGFEPLARVTLYLGEKKILFLLQ